MEITRYLTLLIAILICSLQKNSLAIEAPENVMVTNEGSTNSLRVTWVAPVDATAHEVMWNPPDTNGTNASGDLDGTANEYNVTDLTPGTLYDVTVIAKNGTNDTMDETRQGRTKPSPVTLMELPSTNDSISVLWSKPSGEVDRYLVSCSEGTVDPSSPIIDNDSETYQASCTELPTAGADYNITVTSQSGGENSSDASEIITALPSAVTDLRETGATSDSVTVTWTKPPGVVSSYNVNCPDNTIKEEDENGGDGSQHTVTCGDLQTAGETYTVEVIAVSGSQVSYPASVNITAYPNTVSLSDTAITTRQITVMWADPDGEEDSFLVDCGVDGSNEFTVLPPGPFEATCDVPMAGADYNITVTSVSGDKNSSVTETFTAATPDQVIISNPTSDTTSITVSWDGIPSADNFRVVCSDGNPSPSSPLPGNATQVTCDGVTSGGNHSVSIVTVENGGDSAATVYYVVAVPSAVTLLEGPSNNTVISATWTNPGSIMDTFEITCSNGTASPPSIDIATSPTDITFTAYCIDLPTPGLEYFLTVVAISYNKRSAMSTVGVHASPASVILMPGDSTTTTVTATWNKPESAVEHYMIECSEGDASPSIIDNTDPQSYSASCVNLPTSGDTYTMNVTSFVDSGNTSSSSYIELTALPEAVTLREEENMVTTDSITASWDNATGVFDYYKVSCSNGTASPSPVNPRDALMVSCTGLETPGDNYTISVTTVSNGQNSTIATITITALPSAVTLLEGPSNNTVISATWTNPDSIMDTFEITCSNGTASPPSIDVAPSPTDMTFTAYCTELPTPGLEYFLTVVAISYNKRSASRNVGVHASPASVALIPGDSTTTTVTATWNQPQSAVEHYMIECSDGDASPSRINDTEQQSYSASCVDLPRPGDTYTMNVTSFVDNGNTRSLSDIDLTALPEAVTLAEERDMVTTDSITASWDNATGAFDYYEVTCSSGTASPSQVNPSEPLRASCTGLDTPGDNYTMSVTTVSSNQRSAIATIAVTALPSRVTNLSELGATTDSVSARWTKPSGVVSSYNATCPNNTVKSLMEDNAGSTYNVTCDDLSTAGDNYLITVIAISGDKTSDPAIVNITAVPEAVELMEAIDDVTTNSISATWVMPNGVVEYFDVTCPVGDPSPDSVNFGEDRIASCVNLPTPGGDYDISVTAVSSGQLSVPDTITITALPEAVDLTEGASNTTVISATWTVPDSVVDNFAITCSNGTASPSFIDSFHAGDELTAYCTDLPTSGEEYDLTVVAISKEKLSARSTVSVFALPLGVDLEEGPSTNTSVSATWLRQNDTVESYRITCSHGDASPPTIADTDQESYSASCVNLPGPGGTYSMTVYSEVGTSNSTRASSFIQLVAEPESVEIISIADYNTTAVNVQWQLKTCSACVYNYFILTFEPDSRDTIRVNYKSGTDEYSSPVSNLTQGRNYNFTVVSVSGVGVNGVSLKMSEEQSVEQRTVPASPRELDAGSGMRSLNLSWIKAEGDADNYTISVNPPHGTATFNNDLEYPAGEVIGLTPGTIYEVSVVTVSGTETSDAITIRPRTNPDRPSQVQNPLAEVMGKNTIVLTYEAPAQPNGDITNYTISYIGTRENNADHEFEADNVTDLTVTFNDLYPGFSYTFTIIAVNDGGLMSEPVSTDPVVTEEEAPEDVREDYSYVNNTIVEDTGTATITVVLPEDLFSQDNGQLLTYSVIITTDQSDSSIRSTNLTYTQARDMRSGGITPAYITKANVPYPFPPSFGSRRRRRATADATVIVGEDGSCSATTSDYCNGQLNDDTQYYYAFRAYNNRGAVTSGVFGPVKTNKKTNVGGIVGGVIGALIGVFVVFVAFVVVKKRRDNENSPRPSIDGSDNPGFVGPNDGHPMNPLRRKTGSSMHRKSNSKPVLLNNFEDHYKRMKADSDLRFTEEYDEIRLVGKDQPIVAALEMVNRAKNRFTNILPYEHSRVKLAALADEPDTDYINANYMPGYNSPREFIACQGPLPGTLDDMWRMIWEKNTSIIVMLTQLVEKGKIKCHQYWPENYDPVTYGSIEVSIQGEQKYENWVIREFTIVKGEEIRKITQFHFMKWPDHGVPSQTWTMLDFVRSVRETVQKQGNDHPVLAHCSAGVGRTGTYIALDRLMQAMQENDFIDIFGVVCEMRMHRNHMVQTEKQYIFIHDCVMDLLQREDDTGESIYVNLGSNGFNHEDVNDNLLDQAV